MAAASKGLGYARGEKVMKEIRGGLPEKDANKGFLGVSIGLLIIIVFCGWVLCREGTGVCETIISMGAIYLIMLNFFIKVSKAYVIDETGVTITFFNFKIWTVHFNWDEYYEVEFGTTRKNEAGVDFVMSFKKKKKCLNDFIFSGTVGCECTEETYALVKSWLPESVRMPKVKF